MLRPLPTAAAALALLLVSSSRAQLLDVKDGNGDVVNSTMITMSVDSLDGIMLVDLPTVLNGAVQKTVKMRRYELNAPDSSYNYFCWGDCWLPAIAHSHLLWNSIAGVPMAPGAAYNGFHAYHEPRGHAGSACFRFVWFDQADEQDTVWVDICFSALEVGVAEQPDPLPGMEVYPTPSASRVTFRFDGVVPGAHRVLVVRNVLGESVRSIPLANDQRTIDLFGGELDSGIWFATLESDGVALATKRFVISDH